jgi:hypothetical protein
LNQIGTKRAADRLDQQVQKNGVKNVSITNVWKVSESTTPRPEILASALCAVKSFPERTLYISLKMKALPLPADN